MPELPKDTLRAVWQTQPVGGEEVDFNRAWLAVRRREQLIHRRDRIVYACAAIIAPSWAAALWFMPDLRLAAGIGLAIALWIAFQTHRRSAARVTPESVDLVCIQFQKALLQRERDLYRAMPFWYLGPLVLGQIAILVALLTSPRFPRTPVFAIAVATFVGTAGTVLLIAWKRSRREAAQLQREIEALTVDELR
jgi:hypothetical protein